jgi:hypothetical protein
MGLESNLWSRVRTAGMELRFRRYLVHMERIENGVGVGRPDVNACVDAVTIDIELKAEERPKRTSTKIRFKVRSSQAIWMHDRVTAGCRTAWVLAQVGTLHDAKFYLIPGNKYEDIVATEDALASMSMLTHARLPMTEILLRACDGF